MKSQKFTEVSKSFFVDPDYKAGLGELGLSSIDTVFSFNSGINLDKSNLARYRTRIRFDIKSPPATLFLKRYESPPALGQLRNWLTARRRISCALTDFVPTASLAAHGIPTPKVIAFGRQWGFVFEKRSFVVTEKIPAESLERKLPSFFNAPSNPENLRARRDFIRRLACFVKTFHETGYRHRDLYFSHVFCGDTGTFYLIDLARTFKPLLLARRYRLKDIAQLYYSAPAEYFSKTDRLRFLLAYTANTKLNKKLKTFIMKIKNKAKRMARHDTKHGRNVPFAG